MNFGKALELLKEGYKVTRKDWNAKGLHIELQVPDKKSKMTRPYIYIVTPPKSTNHYGKDGDKENKIPWLPSNTDLLAEDWNIVE